MPKKRGRKSLKHDEESQDCKLENEAIDEECSECSIDEQEREIVGKYYPNKRQTKSFHKENSNLLPVLAAGEPLVAQIYEEPLNKMMATKAAETYLRNKMKLQEES